MGYLAIELARTIDEDRFRDAEDCHRIDEALSALQRPSANLVQNLIHALRGVMIREAHVATEQQTRALAELS